jgi:hypothetical protein
LSSPFDQIAGTAGPFVRDSIRRLLSRGALMSLWLFFAIYAVSLIVTFSAGIWLLLHLTALARIVEGHADVVPSPKRPRASRRAVRLALAAFGGGLLLTVTMQILAITGVADGWAG